MTVKNQVENKNPSASVLKTDGGKTKSNAIEVPSIALPKGGGAIKGIDEKFSVNAVNGTASFSIPLPFSPARGATPALSLSYNSGSGNGIFGLGWNLGLASIKRKTENGLPKYFDDQDSDVFLFSEAEDLVPEFKKDVNGILVKENGEYIIFEKDSPDNLHKIRFYKPRIEGLFARIERWTEKKNGTIKWRVITKDNVTTLFGWSDSSIIATGKKDEVKIFEWFPELVFDDKGNCSHYIYKKENDEGFDPSQLHNQNRFNQGVIKYTNIYLEKILYGNKTPYKKFGDIFPIESEYMFQTVFDYGSANANDSPEKINTWNYRQDAFSDYRAGFEIRTTRLCKRVLLFHRFDGPNEYNGLVKSLEFNYDTTTQRDFTFLKSVVASGYIKNANTYFRKDLPAMEFAYQRHDWNKEVKSISTENLVHAPEGIDESRYQFTDLFNEGLSGILTEQAGGWYYKHNLGNGNFENAKLLTPRPSFTGLGNQLQLADLDANGGKQLVNYAAGSRGYFELTDDKEWKSLTNFRTLPNINFNDANTRMLDLDGDGKTDILISEDSTFAWYESAGKNGFANFYRTIKPFDEEAGPSIIFDDDKQTIFLADMSGDGLSDIVRIRNGEVCYWPNLGYGKFGSKVLMDNAPVFDFPDSFSPALIRLADIDGSGTTDIIYLGKNKFSCWTNLSGNSFSTVPFEIDSFPEVHNEAKITVADLLGNGVACIVWSSALAQDAHAPLKYIDLMNSKKPHIMVGCKNNMGKEVTMEYRPSTNFYIEDKLAGKPWVTNLHFPVHCISKTEIRDMISGHSFISSYKYHHGYYDHPEKEFRGFGMVEQIDAEHFEHWAKGNAANIVDKELHQEPVITKTWIHTGAFLREEKILGHFAHEYWYEEMKRQDFPVTHHEFVLPDAKIIAARGLDPTLVDHLSAQELQEAIRACKGMSLRSEVFAVDAVRNGDTQTSKVRELTPFSVQTHNCVIELLQPKGKNRHAIFIVKESEAITYNYERDAEDPRIAHNLNIKLDEYGNVLESAAVVYPRVLTDGSLPIETQQEQGKTAIIYTLSQFAKIDKIEDDVHRLPLPSEVKTFELKGVDKIGLFYFVTDFVDVQSGLTILNDSKSSIAEYHELNKQPTPGKAQKRLIEHARTIYYRNDLSGALPLHELESLAIPFESYQLAYTPELINDIYGTKVDAALLTEGKFTHSEGDNNWWIRSGTTQFIEGPETVSAAQARFYLPISYTDPYAATTKVVYGNYHLFIRETTDALLNKTAVTKFNYRTLSPRQMKDVNDNLSEVITDELGLVKAMAVMGKDLNYDGVGDEADNLAGLEEITTNEQNDIDSFFLVANATGVCQSQDLKANAEQLLKNSTSRFIYDFDSYKNNGKPAVVTAIAREQHFKSNPQSPLQISFEYTNGLGKVIMKKVQAEPGKAKQVTINANDSLTITEPDTAPLLRWIGNGRTILNNKGNAVKQYEPFFSVSPKFEDEEELVETGVTPIMYYDALGRLIKTEMPNDTFSKVEFTSWQQIMYDANDTVEQSEWYKKRTVTTRPDFIVDTKEQEAALKTFAHRNTPSELHLDTWGRPVLQIENNSTNAARNDKLYKTKIELDVEGNLRKVTDARALPENTNNGNVVMQYKYDMLGNKVYQKSMDAGQRWLMINILGNPLRTWDERNHEFQYYYDILHRPSFSVVKGGDTPGVTLNHFFERIFYGENQADDKQKNLRGKPTRHYDTGGLIETLEYDFKGQPKSITRRLFARYKEVANWADANLQSNLDPVAFTIVTETDALGRITKQTAPDGSIIRPSYNDAGLLNSETVEHVNTAAAVEYITDINYNEKGQRNFIKYGNGVKTIFEYDKLTFRLAQLKSNHNNNVLQDLYFTYDPVGNIISIKDDAYDPEFFSNQIVEPVCNYSYDPLYRLTEATGRENSAALSLNVNDNWNDAPFMQPNPMAVRTYTQAYKYDSVGNIEEMKHNAAGNVWTRKYDYEKTNNRLKTTEIGTQTYNYPHHPLHGFIIKMPHLEEMGWNFKEELVRTIRQKVNPGNGTAETTYYQYDGQGQRIRKVTENSAMAGAIPTKKEERVYIAGYELYKKLSGTYAGLERITLSLMDEGHRFVMIETRNDIDDGTEKRLVRYQLHNHLGSAAVELGKNAEVISYEEYHPYGMTAYQAKNKNVQCTAKRYRYTGMERDEETGLEYHQARYYLTWLGRWVSSDPIGLKDGVNLYIYAQGSPFRYVDKTGRYSAAPDTEKNRKIESDIGLTIVMLFEDETTREKVVGKGFSKRGWFVKKEAYAEGTGAGINERLRPFGDKTEKLNYLVPKNNSKHEYSGYTYCSAVTFQFSLLAIEKANRESKDYSFGKIKKDDYVKLLEFQKLWYRSEVSLGAPEALVKMKLGYYVKGKDIESQLHPGALVNYYGSSKSGSAGGHSIIFLAYDESFSFSKYFRNIFASKSVGEFFSNLFNFSKAYERSGIVAISQGEKKTYSFETLEKKGAVAANWLPTKEQLKKIK